MKQIRLILESERRVGRDPIAFLSQNTIADGQYVSLGYIVEQALSKDRRHVDQENDSELSKVIRDTKNRPFRADMKALQNSQSYQDALNGVKKTAKFDALNNVHILKFGRYSFQWMSTESQRDSYENKEVPKEWSIRARHGFLNPNTMAPGEYEEATKTASWRDKYGGNNVMPSYRSFNPQDKVSHVVSPDNRDFFINDEGDISFKTIFGPSSIHAYDFFYVRESNGKMIPLDREAYFFLASAFGKKRVKEAKEQIDEEEQEFLDEMAELTLEFTRCSFQWDRVLYIAGYESETGEPFVWINDEIIKETYSYLDNDDLQRLIAENIEIAKQEIEKLIQQNNVSR